MVAAGITHHTALHRQRLNLLVKLPVRIIKVAYLTQEGDFLVDLVPDVAVEHLEFLHNLLTRIDLGVFTEGGMESLELDESILIQLDFVIRDAERILPDFQCVASGGWSSRANRSSR